MSQARWLWTNLHFRLLDKACAMALFFPLTHPEDRARSVADRQNVPRIPGHTDSDWWECRPVAYNNIYSEKKVEVARSRRVCTMSQKTPRGPLVRVFPPLGLCIHKRHQPWMLWPHFYAEATGRHATAATVTGLDTMVDVAGQPSDQIFRGALNISLNIS